MIDSDSAESESDLKRAIMPDYAVESESARTCYYAEKLL